MELNIEDGYLYFPASATGGVLNAVPLWFVALILLVFIALVAVALAAALSNKRHGQNP